MALVRDIEAGVDKNLPSKASPPCQFVQSSNSQARHNLQDHVQHQRPKK